MKKTVAYTAIINPKKPFGIRDNIDSLRMKSSELKMPCVCFTNNPDMRSTAECEVIYVNVETTAILTAKKIKFLPHLFLLEKYDRSVWVDAKMNVLKPIDALADKLLNRGNFFAKKHDKRDCVYKEALRAMDHDPKAITTQIKSYKEDGYPERNGLIASGIIFRNHKNEDLIKCEEFWWNEVQKFSKRDQISFPYAAWKTDFKYDLIPDKYSSGAKWGPYFHPYHHRIKRGRKTQWC